MLVSSDLVLLFLVLSVFRVAWAWRSTCFQAQPIFKLWITDSGCPFGQLSNGLVCSQTNQLLLLGLSLPLLDCSPVPEKSQGVQITWEFGLKKPPYRAWEMPVRLAHLTLLARISGGRHMPLPTTYLDACWSWLFYDHNPSSILPKVISECWEQDKWLWSQ